MSWEHVKAAWRVAEGLDIYSRTVLLDLARLANNLGQSYPSHRYLARHDGLSVTKVKSTLKVLRELGLVTAVEEKPEGRPQTTNTYTVHLPAMSRLAPRSRGDGGVVTTRRGRGPEATTSPPSPRDPLTSFDTDDVLRGSSGVSDVGRRDGDVDPSEAHCSQPVTDGANLRLIPGGRAA